MRSTLKFFLKHYIFWMLVFVFFRLIFLASLYPFSSTVPWAEIAASILSGFRLDISTASYFVMLPFIIAVIAVFTDNEAVYRSMKIYYLIILFLVIVLSLANIIIYRNWGTLLNSRGLAFVAQPREMLASVTTGQLILYCCVIITIFAGFRKLFLHWVQRAFLQITGTAYRRLIALILCVPLLVIGLRGGLQLIPVNESAATFSTHRELNQVAVNNIWYLGHNIYQSNRDEENPYVWMNDGEAATIIDTLIAGSVHEHAKLLSGSARPNVVILLLESWTADIIGPMGGDSSVTPAFNSLCREGLLFTAIYSSGFRTDQALVSVLSGFPAQPNRSIIRFPVKTSRLPSITPILKKQGYRTSFYYGGELDFANMNNYLLASGFEQTISEDDFSEEMRNSKWGAHDQYVFEKHAKELGTSPAPFFSVLLTLSTHEPFEVPIPTPFTSEKESEKFKKSAWYTDKCLGDYFNRIRKEAWAGNTVFILMADHGHRLPLERNYLDPAMRKIPLLIWSPLLKQEYRGAQNPVLGNQHDLAATLLAELGLDHQEFKWSNDLMENTRNNFAYLNQDLAITWLTDTDTCVLSLEPGATSESSDARSCAVTKAYLQHLYGTFLAY